jgi:hypothetical protein
VSKWPLALSLLAGTAAVAASLARLRGVRHSSAMDPRWLARELRRLDARGVRELVARLPNESAERELLEAVLDAPGPVVAAALREHGHAIRHALGARGLVPRGAGRAALAAGTAIGIVTLVRGLPAAAPDIPGAMGAFLVGLAAAGAAAQIGRQAERDAEARREAWAVVHGVLQTRFAPPSAAIPTPSDGPSGSREGRLGGGSPLATR